MPKLRVISGKKLASQFEKLNFVIVSQRGSHIKMHRSLGVLQTLVIPNHKSISKGTLKEIYNQASAYFSQAELKKIFYS